MRHLFKYLLSITLAFMPLLSMADGDAKWYSQATGQWLTCRINNPAVAATDTHGRIMTVVYLEHLSCEKVGRNSIRKDVRWLLGQGYRVIELDYRHHPLATTPHLNRDIIAINDTLAKGRFCGTDNISDSRAYILMEGYRIQRDVSYYHDDPSIYNYPTQYASATAGGSVQQGDSLYMDIIYPANPRHKVPTVLSFSYSNSYPGTAGEGLTDKYRHRRMYLGYTYSMFDDTILEGAPAAGMAWAIADHPKYCDWGRGNPPNGAQKAYGAIQIADDAARKVRAAIRTLRAFSITHKMSPRIGLYGFSRGSTAASLAIGDSPFDSWQDTSRSRKTLSHVDLNHISSDIQAAILGPGIFDYSLMSPSRNEYKHIDTYCQTTSDPAAAWREQGGACAISQRAVPSLLFWNSSDDSAYGIQAEHLINLFRKTGTAFSTIKDYGQGHSVPQEPQHITEIYTFLRDNLIDQR